MPRFLRLCLLSALAYNASASTVTATVMGLLGGRNHPPSPELLEEVLMTEQRQNQSTTTSQQVSDPEEVLLTPSRTVFKAQRQGTTRIKGDSKSLLAFLTSEESRKIVLNTNHFEQTGANTFRCEMEPIQFFNARIVPVLEMEVDIRSDKPLATISAVSARVKKGEDGSEATAGYAHRGEINEASLRLETLNHVTWTEKGDGTLLLSSDLKMEISMEKPRWVMVGNGMMGHMGSMILQQALRKAISDFLRKITAGYESWAAAQLL